MIERERGTPEAYWNRSKEKNPINPKLGTREGSKCEKILLFWHVRGPSKRVKKLHHFIWERSQLGFGSQKPRG